MDGYWKFLDEMSESNPDEYKKFISKQMDEMKEDKEKEKAEETKKHTIKSTPSFSVKILIARKVENK
jgi:hypothetical protein